MTRFPTSLVAAEWTKLRSVRSTPLILAVATVATIAIAVLQARSTISAWDSWTARARAEFDPVFTTFTGFQLAQMAFALLGILAVTAEYSTGTIRSTFAAVPRRGRVLTAKLLVLGTVALVTGLALAFTAFFAAQSVLAGKHLDVTLDTPNVLRALLGQGFYLCTAAILGAAIGTLLRHTAGATTLTTGLMFLSTTVFKAISPDGSTALIHWSPAAAAEGLTWTTFHDPDWPPPGSALIVCLTYLAVGITAATWRLTRRDV
ncbi:ABC transporter permease subunit [Actinokineospora auranticolor]|uniref:ABC-type transport system involved in multi-copper enzyme maturation permease subunit n=1 Tax=Actinokineospora auranticolor TaxID=155976 RepID=A0A2S6GI26_9PSEU|nr:ABC transporter permease subunit [Actinokineospora auranticolor]PPK64806.1 ABC-type transport system involved in multi-copper enzyme maturation permease subunit [Actinokineospora auranticolor]